MYQCHHTDKEDLAKSSRLSRTIGSDVGASGFWRKLKKGSNMPAFPLVEDAFHALKGHTILAEYS